MGTRRLMDPTKEQEAAWRATLERLGESAVRFDLQMRQGVGIGMNNDVMHRFAFQWLRDKERERESRERVTVRCKMDTRCCCRCGDNRRVGDYCHCYDQPVIEPRPLSSRGIATW